MYNAGNLLAEFSTGPLLYHAFNFQEIISAADAVGDQELRIVTPPSA
jgi:hypothetical protein